MPLRLLLDEDSKRKLLIEALMEAGHDVATTATEGIDGYADEAVLDYCLACGRVVVTRNANDFQELHRRSLRHCGIFVIYPPEQGDPELNIGQIVRAINNLANNQVPFENSVYTLNDWTF